MSQGVLCGIGCGVCCLLSILVVVLVSVGTVEPIEYGIVYNSISKKVDTEQVYPGGWYFIGPISSFITYPSTLVNIDFTEYEGAEHPPMEVKDSIGQTITFSFSIQYRLQQENIGKLYDGYQKTYLSVFLSKIDNAVRQKVGTFDSTMFWKQRSVAGEILREAVNQELQKLYANCTSLQIINIKLQPKREQSLIQTQVANQQGKTKTNEQKAKEIRSGISVNSSMADKNITIIQGRAQGDAKDILAQASANATNITISATADAYKLLDDNLALQDIALDQFIYYADLQTSEQTSYLVGIKNALVSLGK